MGSLVVLYPNFVSDGQSWKFVKKYQITIPANFTIHGIDISKHNGNIDWENLESNKEKGKDLGFIFIKATEGVDMVDEKFAKNWQNAKNNGYRRGAYHFFIPSADPKLQALNFILNFKYSEGDIVPVLDFENKGTSNISDKKILENVKVWLEIVERHTGKKPIIYTNRPIYRDFVKGNLDKYPLWISDFYAKDLEGFDNSNIIMWQHTDLGQLNGVKGNVDFNVFLGTDHKFKKYLL